MVAKTRISVPCTNCGKLTEVIPYFLKHNAHHFCCNFCRITWLKEFLHKRKGTFHHSNAAKQRLSQYPHARGENHYNWKGGRNFTGATNQKYAVIYVNKRKYVGEQRIVMEKILGRKLTKKEIVHHIDGDRLNNNPNNITRLSKEDHFRIHQEIALTVPPEAAYTDPAVRQAARDLELEWGIADPYFIYALAWMVEQVGKGRLRELET